jgi:hypothetical protein
MQSLQKRGHEVTRVLIESEVRHAHRSMSGKKKEEKKRREKKDEKEDEQEGKVN